MASTGSSFEERDKSEHVEPSVVPEFETLVVPLGATWMSLARTRGVFERDVLPAHPGANPLVSGAFAKEIHPTLTSAIPFCDIGDNRPWLAFFETTQRGMTTRYVLPMQIEWVRFDRERYNPQRLRRGTPGRARRHLAGRRDRPDFHRAAAAQSARRPDVEEDARLEFRPTSRLSDRADQTARANPRASKPNSPTARRWSTTTMSSRSIESCESGINPEIEVGRFLTEVAGFANTPALLGSVELLEGDDQRDRHRARLRRKPGRCLDRDTAYLDRFVEEQRLLAAKRTPRRKRRAGPLSALHVADGATRRRNAHGAGRQQDGLLISRQNRSDPPTSGAGSRI